MELTNILNEELSAKWAQLRGISIVSFGMNSVKAPESDEAMIKELQRTAVYRNPSMAAATLVNAQADAMRAAASNKTTGPMMAFAGMNMANMAGGMNANTLFTMGQQNGGMSGQMGNGMPGQMNSGMAGQMGNGMSGQMDNGMPGQMNSGMAGQMGNGMAGQTNAGMQGQTPGHAGGNNTGWMCSCGQMNKGKFCSECGQKKPAGELLYRCDKCGWEPEDPQNPPKFCPECGDPFNEMDIR